MRRSVLWAGVVLLAAFGVVSSTARAAGDWEIDTTMQFWAAGVDGDMTVRGIENDVDVSFSDVMENFDIGWMPSIEFRQDRWGMFLNGLYFDLGNSEEGELFGIDVEADLKFMTVAGGWFYRFGELPMGDEQFTAAFDVMGGARYTRVETGLDFENQLWGLLEDVDFNKDWIEPLVGVRMMLPLSDWCTLGVRGDVSGFGVGSASELTWDVQAGFAFALTEKVNLKVGYRVLGLDYEGDNDNAADLTMSGPIVGIVVQW